MRWEQAQRMTGVNNERLFISHLREIFHCQPVLGPVLKNCTIAAVSDQLMGVLGHCRIKIVGYHQHNGRRLL